MKYNMTELCNVVCYCFWVLGVEIPLARATAAYYS